MSELRRIPLSTGITLNVALVVRLPDAGHFAPWEARAPVAEAPGHFLVDQAAATAPAQ